MPATGHFAGPDAERLAALREVMADPSVDAVWFARGGYGSNRIAEAAVRDLPDAARGQDITWAIRMPASCSPRSTGPGLSVAHGPMVQDVLRDGGEAAIERALDWLVRRDPAALEPGLQPGSRRWRST